MVDIMMQPSLNHFQQLSFGQCSASWFGAAGLDGGREVPSDTPACLDLEDQPSPHASECSTGVVPCFASELEREVAELEEEARREPSWYGGAFGLAGDAYASDTTWHTEDKAAGDDLLSMDGQENSSESSGGAFPVSPVVACAEVLEESGSTLLPGAWRGCCKSARCDRADRHRGLCNHKATVPGPAAAEAESGSSDVLMRDQQADMSDNDEGMGVEDSSDDMEASPELDQALSGGHSHTQKNGQAEEREVASALKHGCKPSASDDAADLMALNAASAEDAATLDFRGTPFSTLPVVRSLQPFWGDAASQSDEFCEHSLHPIFQLDDDAPALLQVESEQQLLREEALVPAGEPLVTTSACRMLDDPCASPGHMLASVRSSSSSSALAAPHGLRMASSLTRAVPPASVMVPMSLASPRPPLAPAAQATPAPPPAAVPAAPAAAPAAATPSSVPNAPKDMAPASVSATPAATPGAAAAAAAAALPAAAPAKRAAPALAVAAPVLKVRTSRNVKATKAAAAAAAEASSPRGKKRTAGRLAANPNGHCCTQCGTQSTPVWRAGPHGPKTLCNACGVRYMKVAKRK